MSYHKKKLAINKRNSGRRALAEKNFQEFSDRGVGNDIWMKALSSSHAGNHKQKLHHQQLQQQFVDDDDYSDELKIIEKKGSILDAPVDFAIAIADLSELEAGGAFTKEFAVINERCNTIGSVNMHIFNDRLGFYLLVRNRNVKHPSYARLAMCLELTREKMVSAKYNLCTSTQIIDDIFFIYCFFFF